MDFPNSQDGTQKLVDPRRLGQTNSILSENDLSDVVCILHPASPAAFRIVEDTARTSPQHVLQNQRSMEVEPSQPLDEVDTFIINQESTGPLDIALRLSSHTKKPFLGWCFGRNPETCDVIMSNDSMKRISNLHFRIFLNNSTVLMLEDTSTNGTLVNDVHLRGKAGRTSSTRMIESTTIIQILSPLPEEAVKFIARIPQRDKNQMRDFSLNLEEYMHNHQLAEERELRKDRGQTRLKYTTQRPPGTTTQGRTTLVSRPFPQATSNTFGMHWNGGDRYNVVGTLGKGAFATVYQLATAMDGQLLAAKELEKRRFMKNGQIDQRLDNEMQIMKALVHDNIVQYIDYHDIGKHLYIIMEYVPAGDLQGYLRHHDVLAEPQAKLMTRQIMSALAYLHQMNITHRDIKPDNILIASEDPFTVKLSDFGLSKVVKNNETFLKTFCGTLLYCAPEVFPHYDAHVAAKGTKRRRGSASTFHSYSQSVDIWSYAAVLWFSLCASPPFEGVVDNTGRGMFDKIMGSNLDVTPLQSRRVSNEAIDLLIRMLNTDPVYRPNEHECLRHKWLYDGTKLERRETGLGAIQEEDSEQLSVFERFTQDKLSQLDINDEANTGNSYYESADESGLGSDDFADLFPNHPSKRVRTDQRFPQTQGRDTEDFNISTESSTHSSNWTSAEDSGALPNFQPSAPRERLFGEIGRSALQSSGVLDIQTNKALALREDTSSSADEPEWERPEEPLTSSRTASGIHLVTVSLQGAESMVRELNMESPLSMNSAAPTPNEPSTPKTPEHVRNLSTSHAQSQEETPKAALLNHHHHGDIGMVTQPSTGITQYASDVTQHIDQDILSRAQPGRVIRTPFESDSRLQGSDLYSTTSLAPVVPHLSHVDDKGAKSNLSSQNGQSEFVRPPLRLGKLTTTSDSFKQMTVRLEKKHTSWGRSPRLDVVYPDMQERAIPRHAFTIWFHADHLIKMDQEGKDWTKLPDLYTGINTYASIGIWVNGVKLPKEAEDGRIHYGRLHTGDVITVFDDKDTNRCFKFICEIYFGASAEPRPEGSIFKVSKENPRPIARKIGDGEA